MDQHDPELDLAVWRYGIISPLLHHDPDNLTKTQLMADMARQSYVREDGKRVRLNPETIRKWLTRYRQGGLPALQNKPRQDKGHHSIPDSIVEAMTGLREDHPRWTFTRILDHMLASGVWNGNKPSPSTLYRFARTRNLLRDPHRQKATPCRSFAYEIFGQLWSADFLHGPKVRVHRNRRKTYLHAIMDDSSRFVVASGFYLSEKVESLICDLKAAVRCYGIPQRFYTDNGPSYASRHLKIVCARLGTQLIHTPPYRPQGRGKIERFFKTVREQFLATDTSKTLEQINISFTKWLERYHQRRHSSLGCPPMQKRLGQPSVCQPVPEVADIENLFLMQRRCKVYKNGTVRLFNQIFEIIDPPLSKRITVYYKPWDLSCVYYGKFYNPAFRLNLTKNAHRFDHP